MMILCNPDAAAGGGTTTLTAPPSAPAAAAAPAAADWRSSLPVDIAGEASLKSIPDVATLAKNYVHAQRLVGADKIALPKPDAGPEAWNELYNKLGRPETPDKYGIPEAVKPHEKLQIDEGKLKGVKEHFHKLGLTEKQGNEILGLYVSELNGQFGSLEAAQKASMEQGVAKLRQEFGDKFDAKVDVARSVVAKYGNDETRQFLADSGLGNNPEFIKLFVKIGESVLEDSANGQGDGLMVKDSTAALAEIGQLKTNKEFLAALTVQNAPGHREAVERWQALHAKAFQGKVADNG